MFKISFNCSKMATPSQTIVTLKQEIVDDQDFPSTSSKEMISLNAIDEIVKTEIKSEECDKSVKIEFQEVKCECDSKDCKCPECLERELLNRGQIVKPEIDDKDELKVKVELKLTNKKLKKRQKQSETKMTKIEKISKWINRISLRDSQISWKTNQTIGMPRILRQTKTTQ